MKYRQSRIKTISKVIVDLTNFEMLISHQRNHAYKLSPFPQYVSGDNKSYTRCLLFITAGTYAVAMFFFKLGSLIYIISTKSKDKYIFVKILTHVLITSLIYL